MTYEEFLAEESVVAQKSFPEKVAYYTNILDKEVAHTKLRAAALFHYARLYYRNGDLAKCRSIMEPFLLTYQTYDYCPEILSCFNVLGAVSHDEEDFNLARYYYNIAIRFAKEHESVDRLALEYNNISISYIAEKDYDTAIHYILLAEKYLKESFTTIGEYVYMNMALAYEKRNDLQAALKALDTCIEKYHGMELVRDDILSVGVTLYYKLGDRKQYEAYKKEILDHLEEMYGSQAIDCCESLLYCCMDDEEYVLVDEILDWLDRYLLVHASELKLKLRVEEYKYQYAKKLGNTTAMLEALQRKDSVYSEVLVASEERRTKEISTQIRINEQLKKAVDSADRANRVKTQFLAHMSHDIRTPINGVMGMLDMIEGTRDPERVSECLGKIRVSTEHLLSLLNDVLDMSKLESDAVVIEHKPFRLDEICQQVDHLIHFQALDSGITIYEQRQGVSHFDLIGSSVHLKQILVNLLSNAVKFTAAGGSIYITLEELEATDKVILYRFTIRDTGCGMSEDFIKEKLFEPFRQGIAAERTKYAGTGLGMAIVKNLVNKMHGSIEVESEEGVGTTFRVILPFELNQHPDSKEESEKKIEKVDIQGKRILVVEDNDLNMEIVEYLLEEAGVNVFKADNGQLALDMFKESVQGFYDAVLMDLMMPIMDGLTATREIRKLERRDAKTVPIIAMTANAFQEDVQKSLEAGMNHHLSKPLRKELLLQTLAQYTI